MHTYLHRTRESKLLEMGDELQNTGDNFSVSCLGWRWHRGKTVFMPRCSSAQRSVASA